MVPFAYTVLIRTVEERGMHSFECESRRQAERIKYHFYRVRDLLLASTIVEDQVLGAAALKMQIGIATLETGAVVIEVSLRTRDEELILNSIAADSHPVADVDASLNRFFKLAKTHLDANTGEELPSGKEPEPPKAV